jgi:hypothetical protein
MEPVVTQPPVTRVPLGSASVLAAGGDPSMQLVPVPVVTIPPRRPPQPPAAQVPQPPQPNMPNGQWANAFSPTQQGPVDPNAFSPQGYDPRVAAHYQMQMQMHQQAMMAQQGMTGHQAPAYGPMAPMMPFPVPPSAQRPLPAAYMGPIPPDPMGNNRGNMMPYGAMPPQVPYGHPSMDRRVPYGPMVPAALPQQIQQSLMDLKEAVYPSQREYAAMRLAEVDAARNPVVVDALLAAAKLDPAATVRASCVQGLARMNANAAPVVAALNGLKTDTDPRVRQEVDNALAVLAPGTMPALVNPTIQPVGAKRP